ncbi:PAS domain S-box protein [Nitrosomonas sp. Nm58]|uniref:sensor histidine kinase n=1 Tax=Nitrosomonas sp. Nm58 TaxID=200126 RepID=UPI00089CAA5E|nr:PAS domain S-box protein [Nitrosomonas sp. Nm58]SDY35829.1 PAS domain S-box-containing protein [Nitrosomonas sp. Nm58]
MELHKRNFEFVRYFLYICIPLVLLIIALLWFLHHIQTNAALSIMKGSERQSVQLAERTIGTVFDILRGDALYLAEHSLMQQWLDTGDPAAQSHLTADFLAFIRHRQLYDQVRFLDEQGQEVVRVRMKEGQPMIMPMEEMRNLLDRQYVQDALAQNEKTVAISPFDLSIDHGTIEHPIRPTIRFSVPVFDSKNQKRGLIVLDYQGQRLLNRLRVLSDLHAGDLWLLNEKGYWLLGPRPELEWGFMYPDRQASRFDHEFGEEVWLSILNDPQVGQWMHEKGMFTYAKVMMAKSPNSVNSEQWLLVSYISPSIMAASMVDFTNDKIIAFIMLSSLVVLLGGVTASYAARRRETEKRVQASEARFRKLLESAPEAIVILEQSGRITLVNKQAETWFGYRRDELVGQLVEKIIPEGFHKEYSRNQEQYIVELQTCSMKEGSELYGRRKDGSRFPIEISLSPFEMDQNRLFTSIIRDMSARRQVEEERQRMETRYRDLVNNLPIGVFRNRPDTNGRFLEVNQAMLGIFEAESVEQLLAHRFSESYCDLTDRMAFINKVTSQGYAKGEELRLKTLKGREFYAALTVAMRKDEAGEIYFDGIIEDISARKDNERQIQRLNDNLSARSQELETINHELESFSYSVSHDLRAPLRAMDGFSRALLDEYADRLDDKGRDRLRRIRAAAQRMAELIDDLLNLSRVSRTELKWEVVSLTQIANKVLDTLRQEAPERAVQCLVQPDLFAHGDTQLLRIMMDNLLGNAWKFTAHRQEAFIEVGCKVNEERVIYFVRDNGAGFDMTYADKLFGVFQRLHDANEFPGTGIGLATVQRVIHKHGGHIWAESAINQGATFYFTLEERK